MERESYSLLHNILPLNPLILIQWTWHCPKKTALSFLSWFETTLVSVALWDGNGHNGSACQIKIPTVLAQRPCLLGLQYYVYSRYNNNNNNDNNKIALDSRFLAYKHSVKDSVLLRQVDPSYGCEVLFLSFCPLIFNWVPSCLIPKPHTILTKIYQKTFSILLYMEKESKESQKPTWCLWKQAK